MNLLMRPSSVAGHQELSPYPNHERAKSVSQSVRRRRSVTRDPNIKTYIDEMYRRRIFRKTSVDQLERRRHVKSAKPSSYSLSSLNYDEQDKYQPIDLKYLSIVYHPPAYDYSHLYFPARCKYVKTNRRGKQTTPCHIGRLESHSALAPHYESVSITENEAFCKYQKPQELYFQKQVCMGPKLATVKKTKMRGTKTKFKGVNTPIKADAFISPWETYEQL